MPSKRYIVKPLLWTGSVRAQKAHSVFGEYIVEPAPDDRYWLIRHYDGSDENYGPNNPFADMDAAKAFAEAEHETYVLNYLIEVTE